MQRKVVLYIVSVLVLVLSLFPMAASASDGGSAIAAEGSPPKSPASTPHGIYRGVSTAVKFDVSPPLSSIAPLVPQESKPFEIPERGTGLEGALGTQDADAALQTTYGPSLIPAPSVSFNGPGNISGVSPPDPVGDVGPNHYVAMSNLSFQIFDKTGNSLYGPALNNTLWAGFGGDCQTDNSGDPIVLYDQISDRWMLSQFTASGPTYFNCVAVSQTPDPTGAYYRWAFSNGTNFPDYPKYGFWSDALYISTRDFAGGATFTGIGAIAINRAQLIAGNPAPTMIMFQATPASAGGAYNLGDGLLPSDLDGSTLPPAGTPNFFMGSMDNGGPYGAPQDALTLWKFTADFTTPANSTFVLANTIPIASYDTIFPCSPTSRNCIPQPATTNKIDILSYRQRPMHRLAYRNFGTHQSLVTNQSVEAATNMAGIRWWEVRSPNSSPVLYQDSTYAPGITDTIHRWMGSIAQDSAGNMALGYSASNGTATFPSVWYTGRLASDPVNTMPQGEGSIINGTGSQTGSGRWGDYTSMNVDPVDDCTFWYVNQWVPTTSSVGWQLRIGAFRFPGCGAPPPIPNIDVTPASLASTQAPNTTTSQTLNVGNTGGGNLTWSIFEDATAPDLVAAGGPAVCDTPADIPWASVNPTAGTTPGGGSTPVNVTFDSTGLAIGTYTGNLCVDSNDPDPGPGSGTDLVVVPVALTVQAAGGGLVCNGPVEGFDTVVPPAGWSVQTTEPNGPQWTTIAGCEETGNFTNGSGGAACASSDAFGAAEFDTSLVTPLFDLTGFGAASLTYTANYQNFAGLDFLDVDISTDGGTIWTNLLSWNEDHGAFRETPGVDVSIDLSAYAGQSGLMLRYRYYDPNTEDFDWYAQIDNVGLNCTVGNPPNIDVDPLSLSSTQDPNTLVQQPLTIANTGGADLIWTLSEELARPATPPVAPSASPTKLRAPDAVQRSAKELRDLVESPTSDVVQDGGYEAGSPNPFWTEASTNFGTPLCDASCSTGQSAGPLSGDWWAWYGGWGGGYEAGNMSQSVTIPSGGPAILTFWVEQYFCSGDPADYLEVNMDGTRLWVTTATDPACGRVGYRQINLDVSAYADDAAHTLEFNSETFGDPTFSNFFVDDVVLGSGDGGVCSNISDVPWLSEVPANGTTIPGGATPVQVTFDSNGLAAGTYTANLCIDSNDPDPGPGNETELVVVPVRLIVTPPTLICNGEGEGFDTTVPPPGWSIASSGPAGPLWTKLGTGLNDCGELGNYASGNGGAACASGLNYPDGPFDTELRSPTFSLVGWTGGQLNFQLNFQSWAGMDRLSVDITNNGGATWTTVHEYATNQGVLQGLPGVNVTLDLDPWAGQANLMLRWRYYSTASSPGWYAQVDEVKIKCSAAPPTAVSLASLSVATNSPLPVPAGLPVAALPAVASLALGAAYVLRRKK